MKLEKYYIVPAEIIESNFPDELEQMKKSCAVIETDMTKEELVKIKKITKNNDIY